MKILITISMVIVFVSMVFVLFIADDIAKNYVECIGSGAGRTVCSLKEVGLPFVMGIVLMGVFVLVDVLVIYFLYSALTSKQSLAFG